MKEGLVQSLRSFLIVIIYGVGGNERKYNSAFRNSKVASVLCTSVLGKRSAGILQCCFSCCSVAVALTLVASNGKSEGFFHAC